MFLMLRFPFILAVAMLVCLALASCEPSSNQMMTFAGPADQHARQLEADLAAEREKTAQLTKRCEQLADEMAKLRGREQQLSLQVQAIGEAPRQRDFYQRQVLALTAQAEALRAQVITLGGTPAAPEPLPPLPSPRAGAAVTSLPSATPPPIYMPTTAPALPASRPAAAIPRENFAAPAASTPAPPTTAPAAAPPPTTRPATLPATRLAAATKAAPPAAPLAPPEDITPSTQESR